MTNDVTQLAVIGGDGIGPEVTEQALHVLERTIGSEAFTIHEYHLGAEHWKATGEVLDDSTLAEISQADAIVLGAVGAAPGSTEVPSGLLERGLLLKLRFALAHSVNLRPSTWYPGTATPLAPEITDAGPIDFIVCREGTEGPYCGNGGSVRTGTPHEIATEVSINTAFGVERVVRDAFSRAAARRGHLTLVHKHNVLVNAGSLWRRIVDEVSAEFPRVTTDYMHVDAVTIALVKEPQQFDVIATDNLFGDIITDLAGAVTGGIGLAPSANVNTSGEYPSMFEPVHGSAPHIAGTGKADPTAAILSMAMLLDHLNRPNDAQRIRKAVSDDIAARVSGPSRATREIGRAIAERL
ncbi:3-isopropylmalate dehydrogenase [Cutibacterium sp. V947]|uniref:3-isopropylmalate dehydrogenase n=1 Tax=Cutibacterium sp. V947 TaxID=3446480 RepID=UPI003EE3068C